MAGKAHHRRRSTPSTPLVPLESYVRRRRFRLFVAWALGIILVAWLVAVDQRGGLLDRARNRDRWRYDGRPFVVKAVVDGQTLEIQDGRGPVTRLRLWGIRTSPPACDSRGQRVQSPGRRCAELARRLVLGRVVRIRLEPHRCRDQSGQLLAYAFLPDGTMLNEWLLTAGVAWADDRHGHQWAERFALLQLQAQREAVGIWRTPPAATPVRRPAVGGCSEVDGAPANG